MVRIALDRRMEVEVIAGGANLSDQVARPQWRWSITRPHAGTSLPPTQPAGTPSSRLLRRRGHNASAHALPAATTGNRQYAGGAAVPRDQTVAQPFGAAGL